MKREHVVSGAAEGLRDVQVLFVAGGAVKIENGGMVSGACCRVHHAVHQHAAAGNPDGFIARWVCSVAQRIAEDGARNIAGLALSQYRQLQRWERAHDRAPKDQNLSLHRYYPKTRKSRTLYHNGSVLPPGTTTKVEAQSGRGKIAGGS